MPGSAVTPFEAAADCVVEGQARALALLLQTNPGLLRERSPHPHHATLLHYTAANGVEPERQKTPPNIVEIAELLLKLGAEVDALADIYGSSTTLALAATSYPPQAAGVQIALLEKLLEYGATLQPERSSGQPSLINACLANGRLPAAEFLAQRGAPVDLESAAGLGYRHELKHNLKAQPISTAEKLQLERGFLWACEYNRAEVVEFLLDQGQSIALQDKDGQTGLHWAAIGGSVDVLRLLLQKNAPLEVRNSYGGTVLDQALWSAAHGGHPETYARIATMLIEAGAKLAPSYPTVNPAVDQVLTRFGAHLDPSLSW